MSSETPMPRPAAAPSSRRRGRIALVLLLAVVVPIGASILYSYPPTEYTFYPGCMLRWLTGLHCPGCGGTRAAHALLHGDLAQAFAYNPLLVLMSPLLLYSCCRVSYTFWTGQKAPGPTLTGWGVKILVATIFAYGIARNIDIYPLSLLAPHAI